MLISMCRKEREESFCLMCLLQTVTELMSVQILNSSIILSYSKTLQNIFYFYVIYLLYSSFYDTFILPLCILIKIKLYHFTPSLTSLQPLPHILSSSPSMSLPLFMSVFVVAYMYEYNLNCSTVDPKALSECEINNNFIEYFIE